MTDPAYLKHLKELWDHMPEENRVLNMEMFAPLFPQKKENGEKKRQEATICMKMFGKARPRVTRHGTFMPKSYERKRKRLADDFGPVLVPGLVKLTVVAYRPIPKSDSKAEQARKLGTYAEPSPDIDNVVGAVMDALFGEDRRVVSIEARKIWGPEAKLEITIEQLEVDNESKIHKP